MKNILIPIDFSMHSMSASSTGAYIAKKNDANIHLVHIVKAPEDWEILTEAQQNRAPEIQNKIFDAEQKAKKFSDLPMFEGVTVIPRVFGGVPYKSILEYAEKYKIDLIIMGAYGISETSTAFIGSTAQKIMRSAPCLVLSVKKDFKPSALKRILFVSDFGEPSVKKPLRTMLDFADGIQAKVDFAFINTPAQFLDSESISKRIKTFEALMHKRKFFIHNDYSREQGIINLCNKLKPNMVAIATHNRRYKANYQLGTTETLIFHSKQPILSAVLN
jgi:nucleotide-binding universal stress UspA family protein